MKKNKIVKTNKLNKFNKEIHKEIAFRGRLVRLCCSKFTLSRFKAANFLVNCLYKGKARSKKVDYKQVFVPSIYHEKGIRTCIYRRKGSFSGFDGRAQKNPVVLWLHGGGYAMGVPEQDVTFIEDLLEAGESTIVVPDYTKSVYSPFPQALYDCYDVLLWIKEHINALGASEDKIFIGGNSAGGGLCVALCMYARAKKEVEIAFQMPIYPMIDDRPTATNQNNGAPVWNTKSNQVAWDLYLGDVESSAVSMYAAPARAINFENLPPALTYVGSLDPFYDETMHYVSNLEGHNVPVKYKVFKGCYHGFDIICPKSSISLEARSFLKEGFRYAVENCSKSQKSN